MKLTSLSRNLAIGTQIGTLFKPLKMALPCVGLGLSIQLVTSSEGIPIYLYYTLSAHRRE